MQFNYQSFNVKDEEKKTKDFRTYGFLNNNLYEDEKDYNEYIINVLEKRLYLAEQNNLELEELNKKYVQDISNLTQSIKMLTDEFSKKLKEIENMSK